MDTQGINSGGSSNDNMTSDFSTLQSHAIKDGSCVISKCWCVCVALSSEFIDCTLSHNKYFGKSVIHGVLESSLRVTIDKKLLCISVCAFYKSSIDIV